MEENEIHTQENNNTASQENQATEIDTTYEMHVLNMMDSINTYQFLNFVMLCLLVGCVVGGNLWKRLAR